MVCVYRLNACVKFKKSPWGVKGEFSHFWFISCCCRVVSEKVFGLLVVCMRFVVHTEWWVLCLLQV